MPRKKKNVQPVTEETINEPEIIEPIEPKVETVEKTKEDEAKPEPLPATLEELAKKEAKFENDTENTFKELIIRLKPVIEFSDRIAQVQQQQQNNPEQKDNNQPAPVMGGLDLKSLMAMAQMFLGSGSSGDSELATLGNQFGKLVLKNAIDNINKPSIQERIGEAVLENYIQKKSKAAADDLRTD